MLPSEVYKVLKIYWKSLFVVVYPLVLLPVFLTNNVPAYRCLYVVLLMAGLWVLEALPLPITALIPMVLFPLMGVLNSSKTSISYLNETNMMLVGGLIIAIAVEHCKLHTRIALNVINLVGCSPRRLNVGLCSVTMFISMWISNTAATAMMIPIIQATLESLEREGVIDMFEKQDKSEQITAPEEDLEKDEQDKRRPTKITMCYFISTAYAASIGGSGCVIGSGTNLAFKGLYEARFPDSPGVEFDKWMILNVPIMLITMIIGVVWFQFYFLGLFRPKSEDAKKVEVGPEGRLIAKGVIRDHIEELGQMSAHEISVGICFVLSILLWFFRKPGFIKGWVEYFTSIKVGDATVAILVVMILFLVPSNPNFIYAFSKDEQKRPKTTSPALLTWKIVNQKMPWGLVFLLGGGFAMADGSKESGMSAMIAGWLREFGSLDRNYVMIIACCTVIVITQIFSSNVACATIVLPVMADLSVISKLHPMFLMMPSSLSCSLAFCLPVSTPPNAIAAAPCNMPTWEMMKVGFGMIVIAAGVLFCIYPFYGTLIWDFDTYPTWAV
ncbi:protein I'm not dead yet [Leptinotarsa decemlineata]|uniref:protein I'm not dead yet n=1 Tax=Leptinotarsa decemlineata TaxID=7539 RepID=UPI003D3096CF